MALEMLPETRRKLARVPALLKEEFPDASEADVLRSVATITRDLLSHATIEDFLPVLVHRYTREQMLDGVARGTSSETSIVGPS